VTVAALLAGLARRGVQLAADGDQLLVDHPDGELTPADLDMLREHKAELLALLRQPAVSQTECRLYVPAPDPVTVRDVLGPAPAAADLEALHHELACALWDLRERCASRQVGGGAILVRGRRLADWLRLDDVAAILRGHSGGVR